MRGTQEGMSWSRALLDGRVTGEQTDRAWLACRVTHLPRAAGTPFRSVLSLGLAGA